MRPLTLLILAALLLLAACAPAAGGPHTAPTPTATSAATLPPDVTLNPRITDAAEYRFYQLLPLDGIPPIYDPQFAPAAEAPLQDEELVLGAALGGQARAYPVAVLVFREMVNDELAGIPTLVTWRPICCTGLVHDRRTDGAPRTFGNAGALFVNALTWYDHETRSTWSQPWGRSIVGPLKGLQLHLLPFELPGSRRIQRRWR